MRHHGDDCGGSRKGIVRAAVGRKTDGGTDSDISRKGGGLSRDVFFVAGKSMRVKRLREVRAANGEHAGAGCR